MNARVERRYPLTAIPFPQSCCPHCARLGSGVEPFRFCRCPDEYITVWSLRQYQALAAKATKPEPRSRGESMLDRWLVQ